MIVLLEYIDLFITHVNIMLGDYYSVDITLILYQAHNSTEILGVSLQITHPFVIQMQGQSKVVNSGGANQLKRKIFYGTN